MCLAHVIQFRYVFQRSLFHNSLTCVVKCLTTQLASEEKSTQNDDPEVRYQLYKFTPTLGKGSNSTNIFQWG